MPRRGAGLTAGGNGFQQDGLEALGGPVDRRRQPRRSGADDEEVAHRAGRVGRCETQGPGQLGVARVAHDAMTPPEHDRGLFRLHPEPLEQGLRLGVGLEVEQTVRQAVPAHELAQATRVGREAGPDDLDTGPRLDQLRPPQEVRAQDDVTEDRVARNNRAQAVCRQHHR